MRVLLAPGAFKHSLSAKKAADAIQRGLEQGGLDARFEQCCIADGGNGTLDAFLTACGGERKTAVVEDPLWRNHEAEFAMLADGETAVIEMATASGIELLSDDERDPMRASTYGTGQLIIAALNEGARRIIIGLGGSATVDGGVGCARALGARFFDEDDNELLGYPASFTKVARIDRSEIDARVYHTDIIVACDVENTLLGPQGAAPVFGPQKGADAFTVLQLEEALGCYAEVLAEQVQDIRDIPGTGAAGGLSAGLIAFADATLQPGFDLWALESDFDERVKAADLVITGEGRLDEQSVFGKGPVAAAKIAADHGKPCLALVGSLAAEPAILRENGISAAYSIVNGPCELSEALENAELLLEQAAEHLAGTIRLAHTLA